ncbi:unnamed protein product [Aphanomyces euteiches]|uniref:DJ-1/PfpI domain-containing protein n=1 Tax=Aphanomyces euteiches TaxID=100861 RepID=A0A6G0WQC7_9STRA|nr:hypothetical protein Ae201684_012849 [Aphanomyces euteiches]KAH9097611.1 hypothetical protein Ae201684P_001087 [Aphanomyces euteiches]KAH9145305.1 hypothetical protein AeRB84_010799 [Aphanomyces euteiches]
MATAAATTTALKRKLGVLIFDELAIMDACGPLQFLNYLRDEIEVVMVSKTKGLKWTAPPEGGVPLHAPHDFETCPKLDILLLPGGRGCRELFYDPAHQEFILRQAKTAEYLLTVCTGSGFLAASGLLDGKRATTNKVAFREITKNYGTEYNIQWVPHARWVVDGNIWTSSGVTAGMDMTNAFLVHLFGAERIQPIVELIEYTPATDPSQDPFSHLIKE